MSISDKVLVLSSGKDVAYFGGDDLPMLAPEEHAFVERMAGRTLTNEAAQLLLKTAVLEAAFELWISEKSTN